jgi:hypothetical protein
MPSTRSGRQSHQRGNPVLQAAALSGTCTIVAALIGGLFTLVSGWSSGSPSSPPANLYATPSPSVTPTPSPSVSPFVWSPSILINPDLSLNSSNFCSWRFGTHPIPLASPPQIDGNPPLVHIDARCVYPEDANPVTGAYATPREIPSEQVTQIPNGTEVSLICYATGETIRDHIDNASDIWLYIEVDGGTPGYIPDVNIGGGYSRQELSVLGLRECARLSR